MNGNRRYSSRSFKTKRLSDTISQKSIFPQPILRIPRLSKASLQRWSEAQVAYLGRSYPYVQEPKRYHRRHSRRIVKPEIQSMINWTLESPSPSSHKSIDRKSIGIETDQVETIEYNDEAIQTIISPSQSPSPDPAEDLQIDHCDQATETEIPPDIITSRSTTVISPKSIASSMHSNTVDERIEQLRYQLKRLWLRRKLISFILFLYVTIMFGLLIILFILISVYQKYPLILYRNSTTTETASKEPTCLSADCPCPWNSERISDRCVGSLNALCTKDIDCQALMICSGMVDGRRRCHCQNFFHYDIENKRCRGEYQAACQNDLECQTSLICQRTNVTGFCTCPAQYQYDPIKKRCLGLSGALCQASVDSCIDHAECLNGICECAHQFIADHKNICVDPCPKIAMNPVKIRYPGNCRRFIDCQRRTKMECPPMTIFNFRTQLCDYRKNILDCQ